MAGGESTIGVRSNLMSIQIRPADLKSDSADLVALFRQHLPAPSDLARFQWLYQEGVYGPARVWVAVEQENGRIVGSAAAYPRKLSFGGQDRLGFVLGDFCIDEKYRSLGPSLQLQRACLAALQEPSFEFVYDFPSRSMMAIYRRLGMEQSGELVRWAKPLRAEQMLLAVVRSKPLARGLGFLANPVLARRGWRGERSSCDLVLLQGPCGAEFSRLDQEIRAQAGVRTSRSAEYLNWRYFGNAAARHEILTARRAGQLVGYVVSTEGTDDARIVDLCSIEEPGVIVRLLFGTVERLRARGAATVSLNAGNAHPWNNLFKRAGFQRREGSPIVVAVAPGSPVSKAEFEHNWFVMQGDRDS
jgi:predicted N-acetyltransferase YhbS